MLAQASNVALASLLRLTKWPGFLRKSEPVHPNSTVVSGDPFDSQRFAHDDGSTMHWTPEPKLDGQGRQEKR